MLGTLTLRQRISSSSCGMKVHMARRAAQPELARIFRQHDHIQSYYTRKAEERGEREISSATATEQTQAANEEGDPGQNRRDEQPLTSDGPLDAPEIRWEP